MPDTSIPRLVSRLESLFEGLETDFHRAYWDAQIEATPPREARRAELELELRRAKGDPAAFEAVREALDEEVHDPVLRRQLEVLRLSLTGNQMDDLHRSELVRLSSAIEGDFATFRPEVEGRRVTDNDIEEILRTSADEGVRRQAWTASKHVGALTAERVKDLVRVRNSVALELGFADYYRMALELQEIPEGWLFDRLDELETLTLEPYRAWKVDLDESLRRRFGTAHVMPWHYADPFFQTLPPDGRVQLDDHLRRSDPTALALRTFSSWDIDLSAVLEASDLYPRDLKSQHAFCLDVDRSGKDVRILANIVPGELWTEIVLHECGHAAYDASIDPKLPYLLRRASHTFVTEAIAILSGRQVREPRWLEEIAGVSADEVAAIEEDLRTAASADSLQFARWGLVMTHFERDLYADSEGDLDARWWDHVARFQLVTPPEDPPAGAWAAKIHLATAPVYYHNYLLGELLASQLAETARNEFGGLIGTPAAGRFLVERVFRPGAFLRWDSLIEQATGKGLSARAFVAEFVA
ncbi:MAG: M2 family metallopeptidase [Actinomycetota bacterium]|nr:M2 family metallopeptidase [Actinomycetota bacterium]